MSINDIFKSEENDENMTKNKFVRNTSAILIGSKELGLSKLDLSNNSQSPLIGHSLNT